MGIQLGVTIYLAAYFGKKLDAYYGNEKRIITLVFIVLAMAVSLYGLLSQIKKMQDKE